MSAEWRMAQYMERKASGQCPACGKALKPETMTVHCDWCAWRKAERTKKWRAKELGQ